MRIIGGIHRSRPLAGPRPGDRDTRPMLDRVKQALFDRLWTLGVFPEAAPDGTIVPEGNVLDVFCGTGHLGLEALSRGADHCTFVERDRHNRQALERNIEALGLGGQTAVLAVDALATGWIAALGHPPLRVVFCDPPFPMARDPAAQGRIVGLLEALAARPGLLEPAAVLVLRTPVDIDPPQPRGWGRPRSARYGVMNLVLYRPT